MFARLQTLKTYPNFKKNDFNFVKKNLSHLKKKKKEKERKKKSIPKSLSTRRFFLSAL